jgi:hypothetical protein
LQAASNVARLQAARVLGELGSESRFEGASAALMAGDALRRIDARSAAQAGIR